jgi:hypothetical protein
MTRTLMLGAVVASVLGMGSASAQTIVVEQGYAPPVYVAPPPVYTAPVVVRPAPRVYIAPAPAYVAPAIPTWRTREVVVERSWDW